VKTLRRKCVARVIVSPAQFQAIAKVSHEQINKYNESYKNPEKGGEPIGVSDFLDLVLSVDFTGSR